MLNAMHYLRNSLLKSGLTLLLLLGLFSCHTEKKPKVFGSANCDASYVLPDDISDVKITNTKIRFYNVTTGEVKEFPSWKDAHVNTGLYNIDYQMECTYSQNGTQKKGKLVSQLNECEIVPPKEQGTVMLNFNMHIVPQVEDFIIEEIFFTGTLHPSGRQYHGDNYVILYNGTDHTLYADRIAFCESRWTTVIKWDYTPDIRHEAFAAYAVYLVPGSGKDHPVKPGGRIVLCDTGIDHRTNNPNSFDLSKADFEWYDVSTVPAHQDYDSPLVPNLDKWFCYTKSFFVLHNRGFRSYVIARVPEDLDKETYLKDYLYNFTYVLTHAGVSYDMSGMAYKIPNKWVIDGVNLSVQAKFLWNILPEDIDAGWTNCGTMDHQKDRYFHSVRRKYLGKDLNGNKILQDTNNSSEDFNPMVMPSFIEQQGTAIDAKGTPCKQKTYDGIVPMD